MRCTSEICFARNSCLISVRSRLLSRLRSPTLINDSSSLGPLRYPGSVRSGVASAELLCFRGKTFVEYAVAASQRLLSPEPASVALQVSESATPFVGRVEHRHLIDLPLSEGQPQLAARQRSTQPLLHRLFRCPVQKLTFPHRQLWSLYLQHP